MLIFVIETSQKPKDRSPISTRPSHSSTSASFLRQNASGTFELTDGALMFQTFTSYYVSSQVVGKDNDCVMVMNRVVRTGGVLLYVVNLNYLGMPFVVDNTDGEWIP